ncbi:hypothetical protein CEXT_743621 [Caerostris extrusa]|uniref:Uncharacterized protein n=1 Tax=Caerostris extrusa TaxID=172846 RepID=A0AAV4MDQ0_CAEEX|nr:hypothetical protein CEXT_743621 [Caerostris extrusa]
MDGSPDALDLCKYFGIGMDRIWVKFWTCEPIYKTNCIWVTRKEDLWKERRHLKEDIYGIGNFIPRFDIFFESAKRHFPLQISCAHEIPFGTYYGTLHFQGNILSLTNMIASTL